MKYYKMVGRNVVECGMLEASAAWESSDGRVVAQDMIGNIRVSTVFLMTDHAFGEGVAPLLFETMVFGGPLDELQERCSTYDQAIRQHSDVMHRVKAAA